MDKIKFDLQFLDLEKDVVTETKSDTTYMDTKGNKKTRPRYHFFWLFVLILIIGRFVFDKYEDFRQERIEALTQTALNYKKNNDPLLQNTIIDLSSAMRQSRSNTEDYLEKMFNLEKKRQLTILAKNEIDGITENLSELKEKVMKDYSYDKENFDKDYALAFSQQKKEVLQKIIKNDKYGLGTDEDKKKYIKTLFDNDINKLYKALDETLGYKKYTLVEKELPKNGIIKNYTKRKAEAPFKISAQSSNSYHNVGKYKVRETPQNYYIKLVDAYSGKIAVTIFVRSGSTVEVNVPLGDYKLRYASGYTWYGEEDLFGHDTSYSKSNEIIDFKNMGYYVSGHSLTLYKTSHGNFQTQTMNAEDF